MSRRITPDLRPLGIVLAVLAAAPAVCSAQQDRPAPVLPPPSLEDTPAPQPAPVAPITNAPAREARSTMNPPAAPQPATPPAMTSPAPEPASPAPAARSEEPMPSASAAPSEEPWYRRWWNSLFGGREESAQRSEPQPEAAPMTQPAARSAPASGRNPGYAGDTERVTVRAGATGQCVRTGAWDRGDMTPDCGGPQQRMAKTEPAPKAAPQPAPKPEPVEVQPLSAPPLKEEKRLEVEPASPPAEPAPQATQPPEPPPTAVAEPAPPPPPPAPQQPVKLATLSADALFALNKSVLKPGARASLDDLATKLARMEYQSIKITGHTDPTGSTKRNDRLSRERANAVKKYLISRGVPASKIQTEGVGSSMPMVIERDCATLPKKQKIACYQPDRRVDIDVTGVQPKMAKQ